MGGDVRPDRHWVRRDVSSVPPQGGYVAKQCPVRAQNDALYPDAERTPVGAFLQSLFDQGNAFEDRIFETLEASGALRITERSRDARIAATMRAAADRVAVILGGELPIDPVNRRAGRPDVLVAARGGGYRAVDVKSGGVLGHARSAIPALLSSLDAPAYEDASIDPARCAKTNRKNLLQLAHYQRMLEAAGIAATDGRFGAIIGREAVVAWMDLDSDVFRSPSSTGLTKRRSTMEVYDFEFGFRLDIIATTHAHLRDPSVELLVRPVRVPECDGCPWEAHCLAELTVGDGDLSLLPGIGFKQWKKHRERGVTTRAELAALTPDDPRYADAEMRDLADQIEQARAWMSPEPFTLRRGIRTLDLPRGDIEIDVDLENAPDGRVYLWGALRADGTTTSYHPFVTWEPLTPEREAANFVAFWSWLCDERAQAAAAGKTLRAYFFSPIETRYMRALGEAAGVRDEVDAFVSSDAWLDLHRIVERQVVTGTSLSLKVLAPLAGFAWEVDDPGGAVSMLQYVTAVDQEAPGAQRAREWLLAYNRNDVEATAAVRAALDGLARRGDTGRT